MLTTFERLICERGNRILDYLIYHELVERFQKRSKVLKFSNLVQGDFRFERCMFV